MLLLGRLKIAPVNYIHVSYTQIWTYGTNLHTGQIWTYVLAATSRWQATIMPLLLQPTQLISTPYAAALYSSLSFHLFTNEPTDSISAELHQCREASVQRCIRAEMHQCRDALQQRCITAEMHCAKMHQCKDALVQRCISAEMHYSRDALLQRCISVVQNCRYYGHL